MPLSLGSQAQLGIGIAISLNNQFSGQANQINQQLMQMRKNSQSALLSAVREYRNFAAGVAATAGAVAFGFFKASQEGAKFQHEINKTAIVGGESLGRTRKDLEKFALSMSKSFTVTPQEVASAMFENVKAGVGKGLEEITKYQIAVATATDESLAGVEGVGEKLLGITNAMGLRATEVIEIGGKKMTQFARVSNATTAAANATMASVYSIGESMEYFSNTAAVAGLTLEQTLALVGKLSQSKITGSSAGTALHNMTQQLVQSVGPFMTKKKAKAWALLGINPNQIASMINKGDIYDALEMIDDRSRGMNRVNRLGVFNALFNMRGQRAMINAFLGGEKSLSGIKGEIEKGVTGDVAMKQSQAMMGDLFSDIKFLNNAFAEFKIGFEKAIEPAVRIAVKVANFIMKATVAFVSTPIGKVLATIVAVTAPIVAVMFAFRAAVFTATLALRTLGNMGASGGFGGLMGGMLGNLGGAFAGRAGLAGVAINRAGRAYVAAGQTVNFGGKLFTAGQMLPKAIMAGGMRGGLGIGSAIGNFFGMGSLAASSSAASGSMLGVLGKIGGWAAKLGGFALRWLPVVGWIWTAVDLLRMIMGNTDETVKHLEVNEAQTRFAQNMIQYMQEREMVTSMPGYSKYLSKLGGFKFGTNNNPQLAGVPLNQTINVNLDGKQIFSTAMQKMLNAQQAAQNDVNLIY